MTRFHEEIRLDILIPEDVLQYTGEDLTDAVATSPLEVCKKKIVQLLTVRQKAIQYLGKARKSYHLSSHVYQNALDQHRRDVLLSVLCSS